MPTWAAAIKKIQHMNFPVHPPRPPRLTAASQRPAWRGTLRARSSLARLFRALCVLLPWLLASPGVILAAEPEAQTTWLCWVVHEETHYLRCVLDSESPAWREIEPGIDELEFLRLFRARFDAGAGREELEHLFQAFNDKFQFINFWYVPIYNEPFETSWREERPQQLMRAYLCPDAAACTVLFHSD
jgi:hypothetical protein